MSSDFKNYILSRYTPSVLVLATAEADRICQEKNGLSVVDLLRPFGFFHHLSGEHATLFIRPDPTTSPSLWGAHVRDRDSFDVEHQYPQDMACVQFQCE